MTRLGAAAGGTAVHPTPSPCPSRPATGHELPCRVRAPHRELRCMGKGCLCMGSILTFLVGPSPLGHRADDRLTAGLHGHMLDPWGLVRFPRRSVLRGNTTLE